jgi:quercetin dioxygenase-like cupin family protein
MHVQRSIDDIPWMQHPTAVGVEIKPLITRRDHGAAVTCMLVKIPTGKEVLEHVHADQDDILYPLAGEGTMWVDGVGELPLIPGVVVRVPKGTRHKIEKVTEELLIHDVFCPYLM